MFPPNVQPNNGSGRSTPMSAASHRSNPEPKPTISAGDSFANLVSFNNSAADKNLSLVEKQKRLQAEKAKKEAENRTRYEAQYGGQNTQFWDILEQGRSQRSAITPVSQQISPSHDDDDILAAFNAAAPVDASTHFPVPSSTSSPQIDTNDLNGASSGGISMRDDTGPFDAFDDDDPFGLTQVKPKSVPELAPAQDEDDFLGLLGKPVSELPRQQPAPLATPLDSHGRESDIPIMPSNKLDRAVAELVDMGFPADKSRQALEKTESGTDVQAAVGWLLNQAHAESRQRSQAQSPANVPSHEPVQRSDSRQRGNLSWMREERLNMPRRDDSRSPATGEKDPAQIASQLGSNFLKTAGSLWKTGSKRFQQAVNDFNVEHDPSQPKWMRDTASPREEPVPQPRPTPRRDTVEQQQSKPQEFTDEALLLEAGDSRPSRNSTRAQPSGGDAHNQASPSPSRPMSQPHFLQRPSRPSSTEPKSRSLRLAAEEQSAQAYVSPARRKRPQAPPPVPPVPEHNVDLFDSPAPSSHPPKQGPSPQTAPLRQSTPIPVRSKAPPRTIPPLSADALLSTNRHREKANEAYKRGDYAAAHQSFSTALGMLPDKHPIAIVIRSNRAMTALKTGEPKSAIDDVDFVLGLIGPAKGEMEMIDLCNGESPKPMKDFFGKALMRKAEALEQLERWADAASAWKMAVECGHGGSTSIQGRNRCEKAAGISKPPLKPAPSARKKPAPAPKKTSALSDLGGGPSSGQDSAAVNRLRKANIAAERADEERFALSESVDARIANWKNGKQDNLRALLGSLDTVLWPEAGWKKINLSELVLPNKVKIQYMKGIAKVHPDKVCFPHFYAKSFTDFVD